MAGPAPTPAGRPRPVLLGVLGMRAGAVAVFCLITVVYAVAIVLTVLAGDPLWPGFLINLVFYAFPLVGALIALRRPRNRIAWLCLAIGVVWGLSGALNAAAVYESSHPGLVPRPDLVLAIGGPLWVPGMFLMGTFLLLLFPDGHLPSTRWRPLAWISAITMIVAYIAYVLEPVAFADSGFPNLENPLGVEALGSFPTAWAWLPLPICIVASAVALLLRYRRATGIERLQLEWLVAAGGAAGLTFLVVISLMVALAMTGGESTQPGFVSSPRWFENLGAAVVLLFALIPLAIGFAILKHRLYEIDRLVSRTVTYTLVVGALAAVYAGGVFLLRGLLPLEGDLAVAASTLVVAALSNPLRRRIQHRVDRRFNRPRYDAEREVERFAGRLRTHLDLDELTDDLLVVVAKTVQPSTAAVWIRGDRR